MTLDACHTRLLDSGSVEGEMRLVDLHPESHRMKPIYAVIGALAALGALGCTASNDATKANGDAGTGAPPEEKNLSCVAILQCAAPCDESDEPCQEACLGRGSEEGKSAVNALVRCATENGCTELECFQTKCAADVATCLAAPAPTGGTPLDGGAAPIGSIPANMIGTWQHISTYGSVDGFVFNADGTAKRTRMQTGTVAGCSSDVSSEANGTAVFSDDGTAFTFNIEVSTASTLKCGAYTSVPATTGAFEFRIEPTSYAGNPIRIVMGSGCSFTNADDVQLYCSSTYYRL
jgi:hypothetical protein